MNPRKASANPPEGDKTNNTQPIPSPGSDPTNPHNQEAAGDWVANEQASDRRNSEPGITDRERQQRKY
jgi:hypothetical protein